jgi:Na+/H+-dicarboxylate symporter
MHKTLKLMTSAPMRLVLAFLVAFYGHPFMPLAVKQFFLSISLSLKEILMVMIPFIIFSSVYSAFAKIRGHALLFASTLLICVIVSNFFSVNLAGIFSYFVVFGNPTIHQPLAITGLEPLWQFTIPKLISNNVVLLISLLLACISNPDITKNIQKVSSQMEKIVDIFLKRLFTPVLPFFIFGFLIKLLTEDIIGDVLAVNPRAFIFMILLLLSYLVVILMAAVIFYKKSAMDILRHILASAITAFTSMSSAAALPFSIKAAEANTGNKNVSDVVIPATVNIHMIGDSICIPILAMILLMAFGHPTPSLSTYLIFAATFTMTKFSGAGVPGGSIMVMIPVLESYLGFTPEMVALITICYMLIDPIATTGNTIGNNLFVIHFNKLYGRISRRQ